VSELPVYSDPAGGVLVVDSSGTDAVDFASADRLGDQSLVSLPRPEVVRLHAQLGAWLEATPSEAP